MTTGTPLRPPEIRPDVPDVTAHGLRPWRAVAVLVAGLLLAALLNPNDLLHRARSMSFGWQRDTAVAIADANRTVSRALWLDRPRRGVDWLFGRGQHSSATPIVTPTGRRRGPGDITRADPLRVYLGGDSVAQSIARSFDATARATGLIAPTEEFRFATGLTRADYFDWPARLRLELAKQPPFDLVIVMFGANDVQPIMTPSGAAAPGTSAWLREYRRRVDAVMALFDQARVPLLWLGQPVMRSAAFDRLIRQMDGIFAQAAAAHPMVTYLDTRPLLADAHGHYAAYLPGSNGEPQLVRTPDGVHLTAAGADRVTAAIMRVIDERWQLSK